MISLFLTGMIILSFLLFLRLLSVTPPITRTQGPSPPCSPSTRKPHILYLLGSGGHTAEMLSLISSPCPSASSSRYKRTYMISRGDALSVKKAAAFEYASTSSPTSYDILEIPRARLVGQSWLSTPWTCAACLAGCVRAFARVGFPDVVVCNGPGSAVVVVGVCFFCKLLGLCRTRIIYVESFARVRSLSLSGRLLYVFTDRFIVQWPGLVEKYRRAEYHGILI
ncbi:unnamed protein product [Tuber melanosporum]|uniref:UDP-N-acetylglucosamine transferase subunit ALG14 n=1 Tax=Tuber melanosporum (strain Mel28) TaxID=656061 RepID=D5GPE3_TUBMM|nr:uncharacterized protein GSTUM_00011693001 [Tuber melanosporum]CAZ86305.1 unnamed protein product [Tuber melanosporum]